MTTDILPLYGHFRASGNHKQVSKVWPYRSRECPPYIVILKNSTSGQQIDFLEGNQTNATEDTRCFAVPYRVLVFLSSDTTGVQDRRGGNSFSQLS